MVSLKFKKFFFYFKTMLISQIYFQIAIREIKTKKRIVIAMKSCNKKK